MYVYGKLHLFLCGENMKEASRKTTDGREKREKESSKRCRCLL